MEGKGGAWVDEGRETGGAWVWTGLGKEEGRERDGVHGCGRGLWMCGRGWGGKREGRETGGAWTKLWEEEGGAVHGHGRGC